MNDKKKFKEHMDPRGYIIFRWLDNRHSSKIIIGVLTGLCLISVVADFIYDRYGHFSIEEVPGFFAVYGFVMFSLIILGATILRSLIKRNENFYGSKAIDSEVSENKKFKDDR